MSNRFKWIAGGLLVGGTLFVLAFYLHNRSAEGFAAFTARDLDEHDARLGKTLPPSAPTIVPAKPISPSQSIRLAVGWLGLPDEVQNRQVGDLLVARLGSVKNLQMVDRQSLDAVLRETQLSYSGLVRAQNAVRVGKLLRADWFLLGSAAKAGGSNGVVVRVVDARTGMFRDAAMFYTGSDVTRLAADLEAFVRQCREAASRPFKPRTYLAVGAFQDLGVNNRQADFPAKLQSYLIQAYQGDTNVAILEREFVDVLLQEVRLDLAGLTDEGTNPVAPIQGAFWLLTGYYQSYEANGFEVEADLHINRMFGTTFTESVRGAPEEPLFRTIKAKIDASITKGNSTPLLPSRRSEISAQIQLGNTMTSDIVIRPGIYRRINAFAWRGDQGKWPQLLREAINAYQAALALDPDNGEAKMGLASCFQDPLINKDSEARKLVREVADGPPKDRWKGRALGALGDYAEHDGNLTEAAAWYRRTAEYLSANISQESTSYSRTPEDFKQLADEIDKRSSAVKLDPAEQLIVDTRTMEAEYQVPNLRLAIIEDDSISTYMSSFGTNRVEATEALNAKLPELFKLAPDIAPHLLAVSVVNQRDTNSEIINLFKHSFDQCAADPNNMLQRAAYFGFVQSTMYDWCMSKKMHALAEHLIEGSYLADLKPAPPIGSIAPLPAITEMQLDKKLRIIKARMAGQQWNDALEMIKTIPPYPFYVNFRSRQSELFIPADLIAECRDNLHLTGEKDPRSFTLSKPLWTFQDPTTFTCDEDSIWMAICCRLWKAGLDSNTKIEVNLPKRPESRITRLCDAGSALWIGTDGDGLIEYDKKSGHCRRFAEKDGLMMNSIGALLLRGDDLWIGFGSILGVENLGGIGKLDLKTGKTISFTPPLRQIPQNFSTPANFNLREETNEPPRHAVFAILSEPSNKLLLPASQGGISRSYDIASNSWETLSMPSSYRGIVGDGRRIVLTLNDNPENRPGWKKIPVAIMEEGRSTFVRVGDVTDAPATDATAIGLDGNDLWVNGVGFVGVIDLKKMAVRKYCYSALGTASGVQIAGGYVWVQFESGICRIPIEVTR